MSYDKIKMNKIFFFINKHITIFIKNIIYSEKLTCYPEEKRKSKIKILCDNFIWLLRFHQANEYYYLWGFDRKNHKKYKQKYINGRKCLKLIEHKNNQFSKNYKEYDIIIHDKFIAAQYMDSLGFPVPKTIALVNNNSILFPKSGEELPLASLVTERKDLFKDCICKPIADWSGRNVFHMEINKDDIIINNKKIEQNDFYNLFSDTKYIIQERIIQHQRMSDLNPHCVNTIRLVTCIHQGKVKPFSAVVRIGTKGNVTDNWHTGGIFVGLNMEKGCLDKHGFSMKTHAGKRYENHPETGIKFEGYEIPCCHQAIELAIKLHKYFYCTHSIGWDIAITGKSPVFIEGNQGWSPYTHMLTEDNFMDQFLKLFK